MLTENERVLKFGFTQSELERQKAAMLTSIENVYNEREKQQSINYAEEYKRNFLIDEILFTAYSPGGNSLYGQKDDISADLAPAILGLSGLGEFDNVSLDKLMSGKSVSVSPYISDLKEGLNDGSSVKDAESLSIPSTHKNEQWKDLGIQEPAGVVEKTVLKGQEAKSMQYLVFHGDFDYNRRNILLINAVGKILTTRLLEVIRERETNLRENNYWLSILSNTYFNSDGDFSHFTDYESIVNSFTADDIKAAVTKWFDFSNYYGVALKPEAAK